MVSSVGRHMDVPPERVHVVPFGPETDRITKPAIDWRADRVVLLRYLGERDAVFEHLQAEVVATLEEEGIEYDVREHDVGGDLFAAVGAVSRAIGDFSDDLVYVNLASGSKVMAIGGMIAAMTAESATPYYVHADDAGSVTPTPATNVTETQSIPRFPMERPEVQEIAVMQFIARSDRVHESAAGQPDYEGEGRPYHDKTTLYEFGEEAALPFMDGVKDNSQAKFGRLDSHIVDPLREQGYLTVEQVGTHRRVMLTDQGENTLAAFEHLVPDHVSEVIDASRHTERST